MRKVSPLQVKQALEAAMLSLGKPRRIRLDNGYPFANSVEKSLPTDLVLWLISIGIEVIFNDVRSPQQNGSVECTQRISSYWANPSKCANAQALQISLDQVAYEHLYVMRQRSKKDMTRADQFPELTCKREVFDPLNINPQEAKDYLAKFRWTRQVFDNGRVSIFGKKIVVGKAYAKLTVRIHYDQYSEQWVLCLNNAKEIIHKQGPSIAFQTLQNLTVFSKNFTT